MYKGKTKTSSFEVFLASCSILLYTGPHMSPLGIKRAVAVLLILSPWIYIPSLFKDVSFIVIGVLLLISTLDLRKKTVIHSEHQENESSPVTHIQASA